MVGSKLGDTSTRLGGRTLPRGGVREKDGLKVAEGAMPDTTIIGTTDSRGLIGNVLRWIAIVSGVLVVVLIIVAIALAILSRTSVFSIEKVQTYDTDHLKAEDVARLVVLEDNATLLNIDDASIQESVQKNPWVGTVGLERWFPSTLRVVVHERALGAVVAMGSGNHAWLLGADGVWIEPCVLEVAANESFNDAALARATKEGVVLVSDVPRTVVPEAGCECTDATILAVQSIQSQLSDDFKSQIVRYSAPSDEDISFMLASGVEISFGSASNAETKEQVAKRILKELEGKLTYINVRVPSHPTYRRLNSDYVREGTGATGRSVEQKSVVPKVRAYKKEGTSEDGTSTTEDTTYQEDTSYDETTSNTTDDSTYDTTDGSTYDTTEESAYDKTDGSTYDTNDGTQNYSDETYSNGSDGDGDNTGYSEDTETYYSDESY